MGGLRAGTINVAFMVAMGLAMEIAVDALEYEDREVRRLRDKLEDALLALPDVDIIGKRELRTPTRFWPVSRGSRGRLFCGI